MTTEADHPPWVAADIAAEKADRPGWLAAKRDDFLRQAEGVRRTQTKAEAGGHSQAAGSFGLVVMHLESEAARLDAELQICLAEQAKLQGRRKARDSSKEARGRQAVFDAATVAPVFAAAWRAGMGRIGLHAAAVDELCRREQLLRDKLITAQEVDNKTLQRRLSSELQGLQRQRLLCTERRAREWLEQRNGKS